MVSSSTLQFDSNLGEMISRASEMETKSRIDGE